MRARRLALVAALAAMPGSTAPAQRALEPAGVSAAERRAAEDTLRALVAARREEPTGGVPLVDAPPARNVWSILASAVLPGAGQALQRRDRAVVYLALEGYAWLQYASDLREGRQERDRYRALASDVARALFSEQRPVGSWDYYERMEHYLESGAYNVVPGTELVPERDTTTANGALWLLARRTYWDDPDVPPDRSSPAYQAALSFYRNRAVQPQFRWSWRNAQLEYDEFKGAVRRSNDGYRRSIRDLGVVIANHVLSTVDAFVSLRLQRRPDSAHTLELIGSMPMARLPHLVGR